MIFPLAASALVVVLDGTIVHSYNPAYLHNGRIVAPLEPFVTAVAGRMEYSGWTLIVTRGDRFAQIAMKQPVAPQRWPETYVELAPLLRALGARVGYDAPRHRVEIEMPPAALVTPTPFNPSVPGVSPAPVFTPPSVATPRPQVSGKPAPRRTPLPVTCC